MQPTTGSTSSRSSNNVKSASFDTASCLPFSHFRHNFGPIAKRRGAPSICTTTNHSLTHCILLSFIRFQGNASPIPAPAPIQPQPPQPQPNPIDAMPKIRSRSSNSSLRNGSFGSSSFSSSAPSLASLMELLKLKSIGVSDELGHSERSGAGVNETFDTSETAAQPHPTKKPRQANQAAASAGRAMLSQTPKSSSDGVLYYEAKTASAPRRRRQVSRSSRGVHQEGPPRKNGSFQGRSRDSFILKIVNGIERGGTAA